jgi:hypothetical protein
VKTPLVPHISRKTKMPIKLSVIVPYMNREAELSRTLSHLQRQTNLDFEVVIAAVGKFPSIDAGRCSFPLRIIEVSGEWDVGHARNIGAAESKGERLFFLDCDITVPAEFVAETIRQVNVDYVWFPIVRNSISLYHADARGYRIWGFGNCGIMRADLVNVGGWDRMSGWGGEDDLLHWKCEMLQLKIIRAESNLVHRDHPHDTSWHKLAPSKEHRVTAVKQQWLRERPASGKIALIPPPLPRMSSVKVKASLLIGVVSCTKYSTRREGCRTGWMQTTATHPEVTVRFVVGSEDVDSPTLGGDTLYVPCKDDYEHLPQKTYWLAFWAAANTYDFLFKCDDDTFVCVDRLLTLLRDEAFSEYRGYEVCPGVASGGGGYLLAPRSIALIADAESMRIATGAEDVLVSQCLGENRIKVLHDKRFWPWANRVPNVWNGQVTAHYVQPAEMGALSRSLSKPYLDKFRLIDGHTEFGAVGVNGYRGFSVNNVAVIELPHAMQFSPNSMISAHAPSRVDIDVLVPLKVTGFLDAAASTCKIQVGMSVDGQVVGSLSKPGDISHSVILKPGRHRLEAHASGNKGHCYTVWHLTDE